MAFSCGLVITSGFLLGTFGSGFPCFNLVICCLFPLSIAFLFFYFPFSSLFCFLLFCSVLFSSTTFHFHFSFLFNVLFLYLFFMFLIFNEHSFNL